MGNCIVLQEKVVKVMKTDGKILEYKAPIKVHQILTHFSCHVISNSLQVIEHLQPNDDLLGGQIYYLLPSLPPPKSSQKKVKFANDHQVKKKVKFANDDQVNDKKVKFANDEKVKFANDQVELLEPNDHQKKEVIRVKIVISKKELQELLSTNEGGLIKVDDMIKNTTTNIIDESMINGKGWKPVLDIVPELDH